MSKPLFAKLAPWIFAGPAVLSVIVFLYGPIVASAVLSVIDWNLLSTDVSFVGLDNYKSLFADADFRLAAWNTVLYCIILVPAQIILPLIIAVMIHAVQGSKLE